MIEQYFGSNHSNCWLLLMFSINFMLIYVIQCSNYIGNEGRTYFSKAQIPTDILAKIWALSDLKRAGKLTRGEFRIAMHLVYWVLQKKPLPNELPATFIQQCIATPSTVAQIPSSGPTLGASMPMV